MDYNKEIKQNDDFILKLQTNFAMIEWGEQADQISHIPKGWRNIVYDLFDAINRYYKQDRREFENTFACKYKFFHNRIISKIRGFIDRMIDPYSQYFDNQNTMRWITNNIEQMARKTFKWKFRKYLVAFITIFNIDVSKHCKRVYPKIFVVQQLKQKLGGLRVYYSGGDEQIEGMIYMAECLASKTCEVTGRKGELCISEHGWLRVLSKGEQKKQNFKSVKN